MRAIIIDAKTKTITEADHPGDLKSMYATIGCELVELVRIDRVNDLWLDEEGLLKATDGVRLYGFAWGTAQNNYYGSAIIFGHDDEGETIATTLTLDRVRNSVEFFDLDPDNLPDVPGPVVMSWPS